MNAEADLAYLSALYGPLHKVQGPHFLTWRRRLFCPDPDCVEARLAMIGRSRRVQLGWQQIRVSLDPGDRWRVAGYRIERVWLARVLISLPPLPDGTLSFGLPQAVRRSSPTPGSPVQSPLHRAVPVLSSVETLYPQVGRHATSRVRGGPGSYWSLALSEDRAGRRFVVVCPECRKRCLVDGSLPDADLRQLTSIAQEAQHG